MPKPEIVSSPPAKERYPEHFEITDIVITKLVEWVHSSNIPESAFTTALGAVKLSSVIRAFNLYKSINLLLENDHWEDAAILSRTMFEILLNLEEVLRDDAHAEERARKYLRFEYLQKSLHMINLSDYDFETGRLSEKEATKIAKLKDVMRPAFSEFAIKPKGKAQTKKKETRWKNSWCGKTIAQLAADSDSPMRKHHYKVIYAYYCAFSHGTPMSVMTSMTFGLSEDQIKNIAQFRDPQEKGNMEMVLSLTTMWILAILLFSESEIPDYDAKWNFEVLPRIFKCYGVKPPDLPWE